MNEWVTQKPEFKEECLVIIASYSKYGWEYATFQIKNVDGEDGQYLGLLTGDGDEWGDIEDMAADKYFVMPLLK